MAKSKSNVVATLAGLYEIPDSQFYLDRVEMMQMDPISGHNESSTMHGVVCWVAGGGQDSLLALLWYLKMHSAQAAGLTVNAVYYMYGQNKSMSAQEIFAIRLQLELLRQAFPDVNFVFSTRNIDFTKEMKGNGMASDTLDTKLNYVVPFRNLRFIVDAAAYLAAKYPWKTRGLLFGANPTTAPAPVGTPQVFAPDNYYAATRDLYNTLITHDPDNYYVAHETSEDDSLQKNNELMAPTIFLQKAGITFALYAFSFWLAKRTGKFINLNNLASSCYTPTSNGSPCLACASCRPRAIAAQQVGTQMDPYYAVVGS